jgi:cytidylate kinase
MVSIAIDGPAGAGKSTIAKLLAKAMGYVYVDTGALYRAIGLFAAEEGIDTDEGLVPRLPEIRAELLYRDGEQRILLNGRDVSEEIRTPEMGMAASRVSAIPEVRAFLLDLQRDMAKRQDVIMDGRDIGTVVLPDATVKIFLTASAESRAERRHREYLAKGEDVSYNKVLEDMIQRDYNDSHRAVAPLSQAADAILADTTELALEESVELIRGIIEERIK